MNYLALGKIMMLDSRLRNTVGVGGNSYDNPHSDGSGNGPPLPIEGERGGDESFSSDEGRVAGSKDERDNESKENRNLNGQMETGDLEKAPDVSAKATPTPILQDPPPTIFNFDCGPADQTLARNRNLRSEIIGNGNKLKISCARLVTNRADERSPGNSSCDNRVNGKRRSEDTVGEDDPDLAPVLAPPPPKRNKDPDFPDRPPSNLETSPKAQFCIFCHEGFLERSDYHAHIAKCNSFLLKVVNFERRSCLVCNRSIRHFSVQGLIRHNYSCLIQYWENAERNSMKTNIKVEKIITEVEDNVSDDEVVAIPDTLPPAVFPQPKPPAAPSPLPKILKQTPKRPISSRTKSSSPSPRPSDNKDKSSEHDSQKFKEKPMKRYSVRTRMRQEGDNDSNAGSKSSSPARNTMLPTVSPPGSTKSAQSQSTVANFTPTPKQLQILEEYWNENKIANPPIFLLAKLTQSSGLTTKQVGSWLQQKRDEEELPHPVPSIHDNQAAVTDLKRAKTFSAPKVKEALNDVRITVLEILKLYAAADQQTKITLEEECINVKEALKEINPFTDDQLKIFHEWEELFLVEVYPEDNEKSWRRLANTFRDKILQVWDRVIVFAKAATSTKLDAATTIVQLAKGSTGQMSWAFLDLFRKIEEKASKSEGIFDYDNDDDDSNDSMESSVSKKFV